MSELNLKDETMDFSPINTHLAFDGLINARHLGGYDTDGGGKTSSHAYIRCESPGRITKEDVDRLDAFGIRTVIDLRSPEEVEAAPNPLQYYQRFCYRNIPVFATDASPEAIAQSGVSMGALYIHMLDGCQASFHTIFGAILAAKGGVLYHCSAGKDRTGVLSALLLLLSGVSEEDVVREYCYTECLLAPLVKTLKENIPGGLSEEAAAEMLAARPEFIETAINHLNETYGGATGYLSALGFSGDEIQALRTRLLPDGKAIRPDAV